MAVQALPEIQSGIVTNVFQVSYNTQRFDWMTMCRRGELAGYHYIVEEDKPLHAIRVQRISGIELPRGPNFSIRIHITHSAFLGENNFWWYEEAQPVDFHNCDSLPTGRQTRIKGRPVDNCIVLRHPNGSDLALRSQPPPIIDNIRQDLQAIGRSFD